MLPHTKRLAEMMMEPADDVSIDPMQDDPAMHDEHKVLQLRMKRKYQLGMIKKMLEESGYGDLAKMTTLSKRDFDEDIGE